MLPTSANGTETSTISASVEAAELEEQQREHREHDQRDDPAQPALAGGEQLVLPGPFDPLAGRERERAGRQRALEQRACARST